MVNYNGKLSSGESEVLMLNRAFLYGDGVFETVKILDGKILFFEDHYFRLMSAMRILRMEIPLTFTMEYLESQIMIVAESIGCRVSARARLTVYRDAGGTYLPLSNTVSFIITASPIESPMYQIEKKQYEVDLYKDFYVSRQLLSTIKTVTKNINVTGSIFAAENGFDNCLLLNDQKSVTEALNGNIFMLVRSRLITPPLSEGCLNGIMRKQIIRLLNNNTNYELIEEPISPFDLQKADELFITNVIMGIQPITRYRKKEFGQENAWKLIAMLNADIQFS